MGVLSGTKLLAAGLAASLAVAGGPAVAVAARGASRQDPAGPGRAQPAKLLRYFSADMAIRHRRFTAGGAQTGPEGRAVVLRIERAQRAGRWVTTLSADRSPGAIIDAPAGRTRLENPFLVARVELRDDEPQPRMFDRRGRPVRPMTPEDLRLVGAAASLRPNRQFGTTSTAGGALVAELGGEGARRRDLVRRFGAAVRERGFDRFVATDAGGTHEVLATATTALPVEVTTRPPAGGQLRTTIDYESRGGYGHVRRLLRSTQQLPSATGYAVTEVELAGVVLSDEVRP